MQGEEPNNSVVVSGWSRSSLKQEEVVEVGVGTWTEVSCHCRGKCVNNFILTRDRT